MPNAETVFAEMMVRPRPFTTVEDEQRSRRELDKECVMNAGRDPLNTIIELQLVASVLALGVSLLWLAIVML